MSYFNIILNDLHRISPSGVREELATTLAENAAHRLISIVPTRYHKIAGLEGGDQVVETLLLVFERHQRVMTKSCSSCGVARGVVCRGNCQASQ